MAVKRYYWLKLHKDFFRQKEIKKLRRIAGGDTYTIIYLKMQLLSLQNGGKIFFDGVETSFAEELALDLDEDPDNVAITLAFLEKHKLVEKIEDDEFLLTAVVNSVGCETAGAERVRRHREGQKALHCNADVTLAKQVRNVETEREIDIDKRTDTDARVTRCLMIVKLLTEQVIHKIL